MQLKTSEVSPEQSFNVGDYVVPYRDITHPDGLTRIEMYHEIAPENPTAWAKYKARMAYFPQEMANWKTVVFDSMTSAELKARKFNERVLNPLPPGKTKETIRKGDGVSPLQWYGASTDAIEFETCERFSGYPLNVVMITHVNHKRNEVSGEILRMPNAPGRLADRAVLATQTQEIYHMTKGKGEDGSSIYLAQTQGDGQWAATTQISAPDPSFPHYESLWANWPIERPPIHVLVYGDFGVGKSQFASTFPKPMIVFMFDGFGKELPYWKHFEF